VAPVRRVRSRVATSAVRSRAPSCFLLAAVAVAALAGCGERVEQVRTLRMSPAAFVTKQAGSRSVLRVAASLSAPGAQAAAIAPVRVPQVGSVAAGAPNAGSLVNGLQLPERGAYWATWDPIRHTIPNRPERRWGTDRLLAYLLTVLRDYQLAHPGAPPVLVGDLSRPYGGPFGSAYGGLGHASHQNGLDADVYYPRLDRTLQAPRDVADVDRALAQELVNRFVAFGAQYAFVGRHVGLGGPAGVVQAIEHHDDHVHVRIAGARR
jgi:hypothetical protein